jgi:hypothetical protein
MTDPSIIESKKDLKQREYGNWLVSLDIFKINNVDSIGQPIISNILKEFKITWPTTLNKIKKQAFNVPPLTDISAKIKSVG